MAALMVWPVGAQQQAPPELSPALVRQVEALMAAKAQRTPAQRKLSSHLLQAAQIAQGEPIGGGAALRQSTVEPDAGGMVTVDLRADVTPAVLARIEALGGSAISSVPQYSAIRTRLPLAAVETLAELDAVQSIRPADEAVTRGQTTAAIRAGAGTAAADPAGTRKVNTSVGDVAHRADQARRQYGVDGTGIGIGVLSDGVDTLAARQASGDLPAAVTVLPGQARPSEADDTDIHDEGTAMLEIVHDLAPGADLYFATAFNGQAQFAANIEALCAAGADVIVDDISYLREAAFQDDIIAQGVNAAVAAGCVYFSAGGNNGNLNDGTSGVWEGDFNAGGSFTIDGKPVGTSHRFSGRANVNRITDYDFDTICLKWSDPLGASANDYDLYLVDPDEASIYTNASSTDTQDGTQDPVECIGRIEYTATKETVDLTRFRLLVIKAAGANRYLHLNTHGGKLNFATDGQMYDHAAAANAIGVAATSVARAGGAGGVFDGTESVRTFSSDGPRRIFFHLDGRTITPGNFSSTGGRLLLKPDLTAADGVSTATPEFETFYGTSPAAAHAAAIAALMLQAAGGPGSLTRAQLLRAMQDTALDIEAPGDWDRDSGAGIIDALAAVAEVETTNGPPVPVGTLPDQRLRVRDGAVMVEVASAFRDLDGDALTYGATSSDVAVVTARVSGSTMTMTPVAAGVATVTVMATDIGGSNTPATQQFTVTVHANQPPVSLGTLPDLTLHVSGPAVANIVRAFRDPEDDALVYRAMSSAVAVATVGVAGTRVTVTPMAPGVTTITVTATDEGGSNTSATQRFAVTVPDGSQFTDRPIQRGTPVRAIHFLELRDRIDALRVREGLLAFRWTDPTITAGVTPVKRVHLTQLRAALDEVYDTAGHARPSYTDASVTAIIVAHLMELRAAVVALE